MGRLLGSCGPFQVLLHPWSIWGRSVGSYPHFFGRFSALTFFGRMSLFLLSRCASHIRRLLSLFLDGFSRTRLATTKGLSASNSARWRSHVLTSSTETVAVTSSRRFWGVQDSQNRGRVLKTQCSLVCEQRVQLTCATQRLDRWCWWKKLQSSATGTSPHTRRRSQTPRDAPAVAVAKPSARNHNASDTGTHSKKVCAAKPTGHSDASWRIQVLRLAQATSPMDFQFGWDISFQRGYFLVSRCVSHGHHVLYVVTRSIGSRHRDLQSGLHEDHSPKRQRARRWR